METENRQFIPAGLDDKVTSFFIRSPREMNAIGRMGVTTLRELVRKGPGDVLKIWSAGRKTINNIEETLWRYGLRLGMSESDIAAYESACRVRQDAKDEPVDTLRVRMRYELAKAMLPQVYASDHPGKGMDYLTPQEVAREAVMYADALIDELRKKEP